MPNDLLIVLLLFGALSVVVLTTAKTRARRMRRLLALGYVAGFLLFYVAMGVVVLYSPWPDF
ncbi:hypothetical protein [Nonomuraea basaltis]|uniref:hypothetical protein n=1 Tax=Nonomuraea basaltis TaxID=2495887 RepID=UPI00110C4B78|nr:hypothetical protein [Nonomuraea basaltis]TMR99978.1 hypothetical protein EJK15_04205 [Nonomuraea basaltis]